MVKTLREKQAEGRAYSIEHGWYDIPRTWGEEIALLHSEASEALDAYRRWGTEDVTKKVCGSTYHISMNGPTPAQENPEAHLCKPEGVGSELADVLIRLLDTCERHNYDIEKGGDEIGWSQEVYGTYGEVAFGDMITHLHHQINFWYLYQTNKHAALIYTRLKAICTAIGIDLEEEYERKYQFNLTRPYRHGNKRL